MPFSVGTKRYTLRSVLAVFAAESRPSGADAGLDAHHAQDPAPSGESLNDVGLFFGFASHWFWLSAIKMSIAPTSGHTCQMLREFDAFVHSKPVIDSYSRLGIGIEPGLSAERGHQP